MLRTERGRSGSVICSCGHHALRRPKRRRKVPVSGVGSLLREILREVCGGFFVGLPEAEIPPGRGRGAARGDGTAHGKPEKRMESREMS